MLELWPEHEKFLKKSFEARSLELLAHNNEIARLVERITRDKLDDFIGGYRWMCEAFVTEELEFRRTGNYRFSTLAEAVREVYGNPAVMKPYMAGVLLSQLTWLNHANALYYYRHFFLNNNAAGYHHLEIGPGHGLFLAEAARDPRCASVNGWDISETSLESARACMGRLAVEREVRLECRDALAQNQSDQQFSSIVISEVLEHMERPLEMLKALKRLCATDGRVFINVPVNSPAPDHIYLLKTPEEAAELVEASGFEILDRRYFPMTGYTEQAARKHDLAISCVFIGH
jgi:ubiquinone/menaquinone biosynthesis C-methylase UbiE